MTRVMLGSLVVLLLAACQQNQAQDWFERGADAYQEGRFAEAVEAYQQGLDLEPESAVGWNLMGMACRMQFNQIRSEEWKRKEEQAFKKAVAADSTFWPAQINLGATLYYQGKPREAAPFFKRALELNPDNPEKERLLEFISEGER